MKLAPIQALFLNTTIIMEIASDFTQWGPSIIKEFPIFLLKRYIVFHV